MQLSTAHLVVVVSVLVFAIDAAYRLIRRRRERSGLPLPPGPTPIPVVGNVLSIDSKEPWKTYTKWHSIYGDIFHLRMLDQDVVVLGSQSVAVELLEKRSRLYSDRSLLATLEPYGLDYFFSFTPYGDHWRLCRRIFHQTFNARAAPAIRPIQLRKARELIVNMVEYPDHYEHQYTIFSTSVSLSTTYGYELSAQNDPLLQFFRDWVVVAVQAAMPERALLFKFFPFLMYIPDWLPGSWLKREANHTRNMCEKLTDIPYQYAEDRMSASVGLPIFCMVSDHLNRARSYDALYREKYVSSLKMSAVSAFLGSTETTVSFLTTFTLAMILHPHAWKRAQEEIDAVVSTDRLPVFDDRPALPYVDAIIRETARWIPIVPLSWHATTDSDVYEGYYIPKGALVVANAWAMLRDEARFPSAEKFVPERFLNGDGTLSDDDPTKILFGFGRRICPGRYVADASLWSAIATMLSTLEFHPPQDSQGNELPVEVKLVHGLALQPEASPCLISLRPHLNLELYKERMRAE